MRFLFIDSRFTLHASYPHLVALVQLRFTSLTVTSSRRDLHPQVCAHAGRTPQPPRPAGRKRELTATFGRVFKVLTFTGDLALGQGL